MRQLIAIASLFVVGCSSGGGGLDPDSFNKQAAIANCAANARCGFIGASEEKQCELDVATTIKMYPPVYSATEAIKSKRAKFDAKLAQTCLGLIQNQGCSTDAYFALLDKCAGLIIGLVPVGGTCLDASECATGGYCDQGTATSSGCSGTCKANVATGATCDPNNDHCNSTDFCDATSMKCTARVGMGQACGDSPLCQTGLICKGYTPADNTTTPPTPQVLGMCKGRGAVGDVCQTGFFGDTDCTLPLFCDDSKTPSTCAMPLALGAACSGFSACADPYTCVGLTFDQNTGAANPGKCGAFLDVGGMCADPAADDTGCPFDAACDMTTKICTGAGKAGATCDTSGFGASCGTNLYCDGPSATCKQAVALGGACVPPVTDSQGNTIGSDPCHDGSCDATSMVCANSCM